MTPAWRSLLRCGHRLASAQNTTCLLPVYSAESIADLDAMTDSKNTGALDAVQPPAPACAPGECQTNQFRGEKMMAFLPLVSDGRQTIVMPVRIGFECNIGRSSERHPNASAITDPRASRKHVLVYCVKEEEPRLQVTTAKPVIVFRRGSPPIIMHQGDSAALQMCDEIHLLPPDHSSSRQLTLNCWTTNTCAYLVQIYGEEGRLADMSTPTATAIECFLRTTQAIIHGGPCLAETGGTSDLLTDIVPSSLDDRSPLSSGEASSSSSFQTGELGHEFTAAAADGSDGSDSESDFKMH